MNGGYLTYEQEINNEMNDKGRKSDNSGILIVLLTLAVIFLTVVPVNNTVRVTVITSDFVINNQLIANN